ncbi:phage portal protein [Bacillus sp. WMMC1349]|uniref:phage portal protein n=1 Tax=Bacillus sp. WMMC1349 TaxID=2736254 RepID=UPI0015568D2F|nr:phage portal protein [Bacillus sp. WMMC1349]NPC91214.1 phage portal protein [Bacillus sp. WMMC1349]
MFQSLIAKIKAVMLKMGLISNIKSVSDMKDLPVNDEFYRYIENVWLPLYRGYLEIYKDENFHKLEYTTIGRGRKIRRMETLGMAKVASEEMARLIFNEKCKLNISNKDLAEEINRILKNNNFYKMFQDHLEYMFALGGMVMKVYVELDRLGNKQIKIGFVTADCFIPLSYSNDRVNEGLFISTTRKGKKFYTLLEWNQWEGQKYVVRNQLFQSDNENELGIEVPLSILYESLAPETVFTKLTRPTFVYIKPNIANNIDLQSPLGISLFANAISNIKAIDTVYDSFLREFRLGKKRIIVPATAVRTHVDRETQAMTRYFDENDEVYEAFDFDSVDNQKIVENDISLRVNEHIAAIQTELDLFSAKIGFSPGTFTFDGKGLKTATEVVSENSKTYKSKNSHETIIEESLKQLVKTICEVAETYGVFNIQKEYEVSVDFDDSIVEDRDSDSNYWLKLQNNGNIPKWMALQNILKVSEEEAKAIIKDAQAEQANELPDIDEQFGGGAS